MDVLLDPTLWVGLITLIILEIVLGIDNLVFIAILAKKLPTHQQDRALYTGLALALLMRLVLLSIMSWLISLTNPLFTVMGHGISARDLILIVGGVFLIFKATMELHERLEARTHNTESKGSRTSFALVITQILLLDAVFSIDSIITAVGMVDHLSIMISAVIIAMIVMMVAIRPLTNFVNAHPTVVVLCLSFLLMIGFSLVAEGLGLHIPKGYLYAAIAFSILIEAFNQIARRNSDKAKRRLPFRERTTMAIVSMMEKRPNDEEDPTPSASETPQTMAATMAPTVESFGADERHMVEGVLSLAERSIRTIMTPRSDIAWLNLNKSFDEILSDAKAMHHSLFPVGDGSIDHLVGFVKARDLISIEADKDALRRLAEQRKPFTVPETISVIRLMRDIKKTRASVVVVTDEFGVIQGLVTSHDILEAIAGDFPDEGDKNLIQPLENEKGFIADGTADLLAIEQVLGIDSLTSADADYVTVAGLLLDRFARIPQVGEKVELHAWRFEVLEMDKTRISSVKMTPIPVAETDEEVDGTTSQA